MLTAPDFEFKGDPDSLVTAFKNDYPSDSLLLEVVFALYSVSSCLETRCPFLSVPITTGKEQATLIATVDFWKLYGGLIKAVDWEKAMADRQDELKQREAKRFRADENTLALIRQEEKSERLRLVKLAVLLYRHTKYRAPLEVSEAFFDATRDFHTIKIVEVEKALAKGMDAFMESFIGSDRYFRSPVNDYKRNYRIIEILFDRGYYVNRVCFFKGCYYYLKENS